MDLVAAGAGGGPPPPSMDVHLALTQHANDVSPVLYKYLIDFMASCDDADLLVATLSDLSQCGAIISRSHAKFEDLLAILFMFDWSVRDARVSQAFEDILVGLFLSLLLSSSCHPGMR